MVRTTVSAQTHTHTHTHTRNTVLLFFFSLSIIHAPTYAHSPVHVFFRSSTRSRHQETQRPASDEREGAVRGCSIVQVGGRGCRGRTLRHPARRHRRLRGTGANAPHNAHSISLGAIISHNLMCSHMGSHTALTLCVDVSSGSAVETTRE